MGFIKYKIDTDHKILEVTDPVKTITPTIIVNGELIRRGESICVPIGCQVDFTHLQDKLIDFDLNKRLIIKTEWATSTCFDYDTIVGLDQVTRDKELEENRTLEFLSTAVKYLIECGRRAKVDGITLGELARKQITDCLWMMVG